VLKFYYHPSPNPAKIALFLEETGLPYEMIAVDTRRGDQHRPAFLAINPNGKAPALVDGDATVFDSTAILLYLAEKSGQLLPANTPELRAELYSWLMFVASGVGPFVGQAVHFAVFAPEKLPYAIERYAYEARRHFDILEARLEGREYLVGDTYTIADISAWGWVRLMPFALGDSAWTNRPNLRAWFDRINARPAAQRAEALKERHNFAPQMDDEARRHLFRHIATEAAVAA